MSKTKMKTLLIPMFALLVLMGTMMISSVAEAATIVKQGVDGDLRWSIDSDGHLLIEGVGDYGEGEPDWYVNRDIIKSATVNVSGITRCSYMFEMLNNVTEIDVTNLDTSKVTDMKRMFSNCSQLKKVDVSGFDTSKVTDMSSMFFGCSNLTYIDVSDFDTSKVTNMESMFACCYWLDNLDVSNFDTSNVTNMQQMFHEYGSSEGGTELDVSNFDTSKVTNVKLMFWNTQLTELDLSNFDMSNVTESDNAEGMFRGDYVKLGRFKTPKNVKVDILLPQNGTWKSTSGTKYTNLPKNKSNSQYLLNIGAPYKEVTRNGKRMVVDSKGVRIATNGMVKASTGVSYYVKDGYIQSVTGLVNYNNKYWYVQNGMWTKVTGLVRHGSQYYYVKAGILNRVTTLVKYGNNYYYVKNGVWTKATTLVKYNGKYWYVKNGGLCKDTTLVKYNGKYYYVTGGAYKNTTTIVKYGNKYYFVYKGTVNFNYTGTYVWNGVRWKIVKGVVVGRA